MFNNYKKFLTIFMISLAWAQLGLSMHAEREVVDNSNQNKASENASDEFIKYMEKEHKLTDKSSDDDINEAYNAHQKDNINNLPAANQAPEIKQLNEYRETHLGKVKEARAKEEERRQKEENILSLSPEELTKIDAADIQALSKEGIAKLSTDQIKALTFDQIKVFTPDQVKAFTPDQIKAFPVKTILQRPNLFAALQPDQIQAIDPQALAQAMEATILSKAQQLNPFNKNNKIQRLPDSFVDGLTPEQAKAILDVHEKSWISHLKDYFSDNQIKKITNLSKASRSISAGGIKKEEAQARNLVIDLANNPNILPALTNPERSTIIKENKEIDTKYSSLLTSMRSLDTSEKQRVLQEYANAINEKESKWLKSTNDKKALSDLKENLYNFIDYIQPLLNKGELALPILENGQYRIEIVDTTKIDPEIATKLKDTINNIKSDSTLNDKENIYAKAYLEYFIATKVDLTKQFRSQIYMFDGMFPDNEKMKEIANNALRTKIQNLKNTIDLATLNPDNLKYLSPEQIGHFTDQFTPDQIVWLKTDQLQYLDAKKLNAMQIRNLLLYNYDQPYATKLSGPIKAHGNNYISRINLLTPEQIQEIPDNILADAMNFSKDEGVINKLKIRLSSKRILTEDTFKAFTNEQKNSISNLNDLYVFFNKEQIKQIKNLSTNAQSANNISNTNFSKPLAMDDTATNSSYSPESITSLNNSIYGDTESNASFNNFPEMNNSSNENSKQ